MTPATAAKVQPTETNPIVIDPVNREIRIAAKVNGTVLPSRPGMRLSIQGVKPPVHPYSRLSYLRISSIPLSLTSVVYRVTIWRNKYEQYLRSRFWHFNYSNLNGAPKAYNLIDVVKDPDGANGKGIKMKFGGNLAANDSAGTGCISCFYSCPIGITSNSAYDNDDMTRQGAAGQAGFLGNQNVLPSNGTIVVLAYKVTS